MTSPADDYFAYKRWFDAGHNALVLPPDCSDLGGPTLSYSNFYTWTLEWYLVFSDAPKSYIRIHEHYEKRRGLDSARRKRWAFNFGPVVKELSGKPSWTSSDPVFVRIDNANNLPPHLHPPDDPSKHIQQNNIGGLLLDQLDMFTFIKAALRCRSHGKTMERELGYKVIP